MLKVSILTPVYNVAKYIERCVKSLMSQTYGNIEFVFVDDGSTDNSVELIKSVVGNYPKRKSAVKIIKNETNRGVSYTRNVALANSTGDYITWVDSDDWIEYDMVEKLVGYITGQNVDVVFCGLNVHYSHGSQKVLPQKQEQTKDILISMLKRNMRSNIAAKLWKKRLYVDNRISFPVNYNSGEDSYVNTQLMYYTKLARFVPLCLYNYDCSREGSATDIAGWDVIRYEKSWNLFRKIEGFFNDKGEEFLDALKVWEIKTASEDIIACIANNCGKTLFQRIFNEHVDKVGEEYWKFVPSLKRVPFYVRNYQLIVIYIKLMRWGKHKLLRKNVR